MKWISLLDTVTGVLSPAPDTADLSAQYKAGRRIGVVTLGEQYLFFRRLWKGYYIPYDALSRFFRRVVAVPAKIGCCNTGEIRVEHLILCAVPGADGGQPGKTGSGGQLGKTGSGGQLGENGGQPGSERELAEIQLPGERAALALMEELRLRAPQAAYGKSRQDGVQERTGPDCVPDSGEHHSDAAEEEAGR